MGGDERGGRRRRVDPGWRTVAGVCLLLTVTSGFTFYSLTVYLHALTASGAFSLASVSWATSLFFLTAGLGGVVVAGLLDRFDVRLVLAGGAAVTALGLVLVGQVRTPWQLLGVYLLLGTGHASTGIVPGTTIVARWFVVRRSTALAFATTGLSVGGIAVAPLVGHLVTVVPLGRLTAMLAAVYLVVALTAASVVLPDPAHLGLAPDGGPAQRDAEPDGVSLASAVRTRAFWIISTTQTLGVLAQVGGLSHVYALGAERVSTSVGSTAVSLAALGSLLGRFVGAAVLRRLSAASFGVLLLVTQALALGVFAVAGSAPALLAGALLFGLTMGNLLLLQPLLVGEAFGLRAFAAVLARSGLVATAGIALGPVLVGLMHEGAGGYTAGFLTVAAVSLAGAVVLRLSARHLAPVDTSPAAAGPAATPRPRRALTEEHR